MSDRNPDSTIFGELRRMARTSGAVGGIAARVAGERIFGVRTDKSAHAEDLKAILGGLKGPLMKVAQFLSTVPDALPEEYAQELATLQANAPPMGWPFVRRRMSSELGPNWESRFSAFGREAAAAASLGQVHRATLPDGTDVACKLQYPDMPSVVEADLRQLKLAVSLYRRMDSALDNGEVYQEMCDRLREELDYLREAAQMKLYGIMLRDTPGVSVPTPVEGYCTRRLLTMTWLDGRPIIKRLEEDPPPEERNAYAKALFRAWYKPFYRYGVIHGDPHLGNYQVRPDRDGINLLDFGTIRVFPPSFVGGVILLYEAVRGPQPLGEVPVRTAGAGPGPLDPGSRGHVLRPQGCRQGACGAEAHRRRPHPARIPADGPCRHRPWQRLPALAGGYQLAPAVHGTGRGFLRSRSGPAPGRRAGGSRGASCRSDADRRGEVARRP
jgi:predicted unusual protein kinase regulating ubiquinone biosynthesis (AarF/ABC1/UbiB family)